MVPRSTTRRATPHPAGSAPGWPPLALAGSPPLQTPRRAGGCPPMEAPATIPSFCCGVGEGGRGRGGGGGGEGAGERGRGRSCRHTLAGWACRAPTASALQHTGGGGGQRVHLTQTTHRSLMGANVCLVLKPKNLPWVLMGLANLSFYDPWVQCGWGFWI